MSDSAERMRRKRAKDRYVEQQAGQARVEAVSLAESREEARVVSKDLPPVDIEARVERARRYAEWRWEAVRTGEVAYL